MTARRPALWLVAPRDRYMRRVATALQQMQWDVSHLIAGEGVLPRLNYSTPDVVVVGPALPGMGIFELARWIRQAVPSREIPILGLVSSPAERREAEVAMCEAIFPMPFSATALARRVDVRARLEFAVATSRRRAISVALPAS